MQIAFFKAIKPERFQQILFLTQHFVSNQVANTDHFPAMVAIRDDRGVFAEVVKHREGIRRETTYAA